MKNLKLFSIMCLVLGFVMICGALFFKTTDFPPRGAVNGACAFGLVIIGSALGAVYRELSILHRKIDEQKSQQETEQNDEG